MVAHQCIGGCGVASGDIVATGTASGTTPGSLGCLLEMTMGGKRAFELQGGEGGKKTATTRTWLEDGDEVRISGVAGDGVGFGECVGRVVPAVGLEELMKMKKEKKGGRGGGGGGGGGGVNGGNGQNGSI